MSDKTLAFQFHNCLGEGGYGEVYLATQHGNIQRQVAVKVLRAEYQEGSDAMNRLRDEGQALAFLAHPAIVQVHEFARIDERLALVMEYIEGADAAIFCSPETLLTPKIALTVVREVAEALSHAFTTSNPKSGRALQLIHRDVKPANIRLTTDGNVKLLDFGVARTDEMDRKAATMMGDVLLTSGFGAPETLGFGIQSAAGDVFALGVCLFQLLTGQDFYGSNDLRVQVNLALDSEDFAAHVTGKMEQIEHPEIRALLTKILHYAHEDRPLAAEIADECDDLIRTLAGETIGQWARRFEWPPLPDTQTSLVGRRIDGQGLVLPPSSKLPDSQLTTPESEPQRPLPPKAPRSSLPPEQPAPPAAPAPPAFDGSTNTLSAPVREVSKAPSMPGPVVEAPPAPMSKTPLILAVFVLMAGLVVFGLGVVLILVTILLS